MNRRSPGTSEPGGSEQVEEKKSQEVRRKRKRKRKETGKEGLKGLRRRGGALRI